MAAPSNPLPDLTRPDVGAALFSTWHVATPERQRAATDAIGDVWDHRPWPTRDLLSYNVYASTDGETLMHHSQWSDTEAYAAYVRTHRQARVDDIDAAVPGIVRQQLAKTRHYRSTGTRGPGAAVGCVVLVTISFDGPDEKRQRAWVDTILADEAGAAPVPGLLSAHFHLAEDGARVLNYAEWTDERAHVDAMRSPGGVGGSSPAWERAMSFPGLKDIRFQRYDFRRGFTRPEE